MRFWRRQANPGAWEVLFLIGWLLLGWVIAVQSQFVAVRHVLWALPAAALVTTRLILAPDIRSIWRFAFGAGVAGLGLVIAATDMELAKIQCKQVATLDKKLSALDVPIYYVGEDAFAHYAAAAGWKPLETGRDLTHQRAFVVCSTATSWSFPNSMRTQALYKDCVRDRGRIPATTMSYGVNFYRTGRFDLPWEIGRVSEIFMEIYGCFASEGNPL